VSGARRAGPAGPGRSWRRRRTAPACCRSSASPWMGRCARRRRSRGWWRVRSRRARSGAARPRGCSPGCGRTGVGGPGPSRRAPPPRPAHRPWGTPRRRVARASLPPLPGRPSRYAHKCRPTSVANGTAEAYDVNSCLPTNVGMQRGVVPWQAPRPPPAAPRPPPEARPPARPHGPAPGGRVAPVHPPGRRPRPPRPTPGAEAPAPGVGPVSPPRAARPAAAACGRAPAPTGRRRCWSAPRSASG
jgi:hypothetical protein